MGHYRQPSPDTARVTLESLKEQLGSLNMRLRLAVQTQDTALCSALEREIREVKLQIDTMMSRC